MYDVYDIYLVFGISVLVGIQIAYIISKIWGFLVKRQKLKYSKTLYRYIRAHYNTLSKDKFVMGKGLFNNECHYNSVQAIEDGLASKIILCMMVTDSGIFPHYINETKEGKYVDNTFGYLYTDVNFDYFFIRYIEEEEFSKLPYYINSLNEKDLRHHCPWIFRRAVKSTLHSFST